MLFYIAILLPVLAAFANCALFDTSGATPFYNCRCDDCYEAVNLNYTYRFFDGSYNKIYVGSNGHVTFEAGYTRYSPDYTSAFSPPIMLAPYWSDIDLIANLNGTISFEETQASNLLAEAKRAVERRDFPGCGDLFEPTSLFIATWENVASYCSESYYYYNDDYADYADCVSFLDDYSYSDDYTDYYDNPDYSDYDYNHSDDYSDYIDYSDYPDDYCYGDYGADYIDSSDYTDDYVNYDDYVQYYRLDYSDDKKRDVTGRHRRHQTKQKPPKPEATPARKSNFYLEENTFQVVLATDGFDTFAIINYDDIQWTFCHQGNKMLFNAGNDVGFYLNPVNQLDDYTNVHQQGRWVYKISESKIREPGCQIIGT